MNELIINSVGLKVDRIKPVTEVKMGQKGHPRKLIDKRVFQRLILGAGAMPVRKIAQLLGVSSQTVLRSMKQYGLKKTFTPLSNCDLDAILSTLKVKQPNMGQRYIFGFLQKNNIHIQRRCIIASINCVMGLGVALQKHMKKRISR